MKVIRVWGHAIFCAGCGSYNMELRVDEMIAYLVKSSDNEIIKCLSCGQLWSKEFIEENFDDFASEENLERIKARMRGIRSYYR